MKGFILSQKKISYLTKSLATGFQASEYTDSSSRGLLVLLKAVTDPSVLLQDTLVHSLACEEPRECKGLRKNLSGKWRRLVKKKPPQEVCTLPAEVREQLKTIYVY